MGNLDISIAKQYHEETKHSEISIRTKGHYLDWENKPYPYKVYNQLPLIKLTKDFPHPSQNAIDCIMGQDARGGSFDLRVLTELLYFSVGITKTIRYPMGGSFDFRAAAATGALYEIETYVVCTEMAGLTAGVYHFDPKDFALAQLRAGDYGSYLYSAAGEEQEVLSAPVTIVLTAIHWRNAWKYQARAYRHFFWDGGTILANMLFTAFSEKLGAKILLGFIDEAISRLLGLEDDRESTVVLVPIGSTNIRPTPPQKEPFPIEEIKHDYRPLSKNELSYPEIVELHSASALRSPDQVKAWRTIAFSKQKAKASSELIPLEPLRPLPKNALGEIIIRRGSTRRFRRQPFPYSYLSSILQASTRGIPADFLSPEGHGLIEVYLIANAVDDLQSGAYYYNRTAEGLELLKLGDFRNTAGYLCLEQRLGSDASVTAFLMADLEAVLTAYGNRGYRAAQLEAGVILGKMYLCAYALEVGASGITFYDDAVTMFFSPHAKGLSNMVSIVVGVPAYGKKPTFLKT